MAIGELKWSSDDDNLYRVTHALGKSGDARAAAALIAVVRQYCANVLPSGDLKENTQLPGLNAVDALVEIADPRVVSPLVKLAKARHPTQALPPLQRGLEKAAADISEHDLLAVAALDRLDEVVGHWDADRTVGGGERVYTWETVESVDCSRVRQLAQEELARRRGTWDTETSEKNGLVPSVKAGTAQEGLPATPKARPTCCLDCVNLGCDKSMGGEVDWTRSASRCDCQEHHRAQ